MVDEVSKPSSVWSLVWAVWRDCPCNDDEQVGDDAKRGETKDNPRDG